MGVENMLLHIDTVVADGQILAFEDGSGVLSGAAGKKNDIVLSATGDDFTKRSRVGRMLKAKLQFGSNDIPSNFANMTGVQISARDSQNNRRVLLTKCTFESLGDIGNGSVDIGWHILSEPQWL